ncbi:hypothetical protein GCM10011534_37460 [Pseudooceanicola nanhaiensis]|uniref:Thoeris protein ThsB TIR-like domain-containing protein n=1 Tax=Pseudooceanicola nanhaiensis TaxID=375761 RepID=A0A917T5G1_9RHOB|nr:TIR domain-containing protein [Pseudooceanicola nanhaiensis]GGM11841.1 hypothetical protein GCM10011534_37460 [Pseudooceanicola nanhaiensis]
MNVFISHSWTYSNHYDKLAEWIFEEYWSINGVRLNFFNTSVPKDNPIHFAPSDKALQTAIYERIAKSDVVVIPTGMYSNHSKWIRKEIDGSALYHKPILAVDPWAQKRASSTVMSASTRAVGWNKQSVIDGVWNLGNGNY